MDIQLKTSHNPQLTRNLTMKRTLSSTICKSIVREPSFVLLVENVYYNGKQFVCFNVVSHEPVTTFDFCKKRK